MSEEPNTGGQLPDTSSRLSETGNREPETIEPPQTENMEVHHHGHVHHQKKWKEYLFQFLMLFLAVTLGFVVENQREHYIEHQREKKFANLLYEDFKTDSALLNRIIKVKEWRKGKLDSLFYFVELPDLQANAAAIYHYACFVDLSYGFAPSDATMQQLRSSGSLRYFRNQKLYNAITNYYSQCNWYKSVEDVSNLNSTQTQFIMAKMFQAQSLISIVAITPDIMDAVQYPKSSMRLLTTDKSILNEFLLNANNKKLNNDIGIMYLRGIRTDLTKLIDKLKDEYNLK